MKLLIYSPPGHGKTRFVGTAQLDERTSPMLLLNYEAGLHTLAKLEPKPDVIDITDWDIYFDVLDYLRSGDHPYKSIAIDSISETHFFAMITIMDAHAATRSDPDLPQLQDYGKAGMQLRRMLRAYRDLPMHIFATAQSKTEEEPREGMVVKPALSGQLSSDVMGIMDVVGYLAITKDDPPIHTLLLSAQRQFRVKARLPWGAAPVEYVDEPTVTNVMDALGY